MRMKMNPDTVFFVNENIDIHNLKKCI